MSEAPDLEPYVPLALWEQSGLPQEARALLVCFVIRLYEELNDISIGSGLEPLRLADGLGMGLGLSLYSARHEIYVAVHWPPEGQQARCHFLAKAFFRSNQPRSAKRV